MGQHTVQHTSTEGLAQSAYNLKMKLHEGAKITFTNRGGLSRREYGLQESKALVKAHNEAKALEADINALEAKAKAYEDNHDNWFDEGFAELRPELQDIQAADFSDTEDLATQDDIPLPALDDGPTTFTPKAPVTLAEHLAHQTTTQQDNYPWVAIGKGKKKKKNNKNKTKATRVPTTPTVAKSFVQGACAILSPKYTKEDTSSSSSQSKEDSTTSNHTTPSYADMAQAGNQHDATDTLQDFH